MLLTKDLIKDVEEKYIPMLKMVNIPDFTKCIAQFSGLSITRVPDIIIKSYLLTWAKNKYRFFELLGNKTQLDISFGYNHLKEDIRMEVKDLGREYPVYSLWLDYFRGQRNNKIKNDWEFSYDFRQKTRELFPSYNMGGSTITHFFKKCLNAPDDLITKIASIFENEKINATYTISIDPVDMMLASDNPYDWTSCYRLELDREDSHADGCLAAILDTTSLITYVWNSEGKFKLYDEFEFKSIRYKRMRQWIAVSQNMTSVHFNDIYPGKSSYDNEFKKQLRGMVEKTIANFKGIEDIWRKNDGKCDCYREYYYGYSEYNDSDVYIQKQAQGEDIVVFDTEIICPCGCGGVLPGSQSESDYGEYDGTGFTCENYEEKYYCGLCEDYCSDQDCENCPCWRNEHPFCDLDVDDEYECPQPDYGYVDDGIMHSCECCCDTCPRWKEHHAEAAAEETSDKVDNSEPTAAEETLAGANNSEPTAANITRFPYAQLCQGIFNVSSSFLTTWNPENNTVALSEDTSNIRNWTTGGVNIE